jgi:hypothetical protein
MSLAGKRGALPRLRGRGKQGVTATHTPKLPALYIASAASLRERVQPDGVCAPTSALLTTASQARHRSSEKSGRA